jgi:uncharacterized protein with HEPN domain
MALNIQQWYYNLPYRDFQRMRQTIATRCQVTQKIIWYWMNGYTKIPSEMHPILTEIVREYSKLPKDAQLFIEFKPTKVS